MEEDTGRILSDIHGLSNPTLVKQIMEIQGHTALREASEEWAKRLRFVNVSRMITKRGSYCRKRRWITRNKTIILSTTAPYEYYP